MTQEIRVDNINVLPTCLDCIAMQERSLEHCRLLIRNGLCRLIIWLHNRNMQPMQIEIEK